MDTADMILHLAPDAHHGNTQVKELINALERNEIMEATVIFITIIPAGLHIDSVFGLLKSLPDESRLVSLWNDARKVGADVVNTIKSEMIEYQAAQPFDYSMVDVIGGTFDMGSNNRVVNLLNLGGTCKVTLQDFQIGKFPVTQKQWTNIMGTNPSWHKGCDTCPVESISWDDVEDFIEKLNDKTGMTYRLPTEAEWEYAARGGIKSRGYRYSGSKTPGRVGWYRNNSEYKIHPVGEKSPNELGIHDMSGGVWEWCQDWYKPYPGGKGDDLTGSYRVLRGGAWDSYSYCCEVTHRYAGMHHLGIDFVGFRLARSK